MSMCKFLDKDYTLEAVVVIKSDVEYYVKNILNILNSTDDTVDIIRHAIGEVTSETFIYRTPSKLYADVLLSYLSQGHRLHKNVTDEDKRIINLNLSEIIRTIYLSLHNVTKYEEYTLISPQLEVIPTDKVYAVDNIELVTHNSITFKFYRSAV